MQLKLRELPRPFDLVCVKWKQLAESAPTVPPFKITMYSVGWIDDAQGTERYLSSHICVDPCGYAYLAGKVTRIPAEDIVSILVIREARDDGSRLVHDQGGTR